MGALGFAWEKREKKNPLFIYLLLGGLSLILKVNSLIFFDWLFDFFIPNE